MQGKYVEELNGWLTVDDDGNQLLYGADEPTDRPLKVDKTMPRNISRLIGTPEYKRNAANSLVTESMYTLENDGDWLSPLRRVGVGWGRIAINDGEAITTIPPEVPESYTGEGWEGTVSRIKTARHIGEVLVQTVLELAGVTTYLLPMLIDGDTSNPNIDILLESPTLNQYGSFDVVGYDVKMHSDSYFTNCPSTFPDSFRVDSTGAHQRKLKACLQRRYSYKGTIHFSVSGGGMLVVPNSTQDAWTIQPNRFYGNGSNVKTEYAAPRSCMFPLEKLIKHYTNNTPALHALNKNVPCPLLAHGLSTTNDQLTQETDEQRWQNSVKMMSQHQLPCYPDALELDASNAPIETKLSFLDSLSAVADEEYPEDDYDYEDFNPDPEWYF